tara:strand:- start:93 stop:272 length:180 start_codon:yes stop_codon:yes gene_type:complete
MSNVDYTFLPRRRGQRYIQLLDELGPIEAAKWVVNNVPEEERDQMIRYITEELDKDEFT